MAPDLGVPVGQWNATVRRSRMGRERKGACMIFSSYADPDGGGIHCGVARFAVDCEIGYSTARRYLAWMRQVGLIELMRSGSQRKGLSDEYRLILGPDVLEHLDVPDPEQYKGLRNELRDANRESQRVRRERVQRSTRESAETGESEPVACGQPTDQRSPRMSAEPAPDCGKPEPPAEASALTIASAETADQRSSGTPSALTQDEPPPLLNTSLEIHTSLKNTGEKLRTDPEVVGHPQASQDPIPISRGKCKITGCGKGWIVVAGQMARCACNPAAAERGPEPPTGGPPDAPGTSGAARDGPPGKRAHPAGNTPQALAERIAA